MDDLDLGDLEDTDTRTMADDPDDDRENKADTSSGNQEDPDINKADSSDTVTEDKTSGDMASEAAGADHEDGGAEADNSSHTADSAAGTDNRSDTADGADISDAQTLSKAHIEKHEVPLVGAPSGVDLVTLYKMLSKIDKDSREFTQVASNLMDNVGDAAEYGADLTDSMDMMIEDLTALHDSLDMYYPDLQASLDDLSELVDRTTDAMNKGVSTMTIVQNTLKATSGDMDEAAKNSLRGSMELLDKSLSILDSTTGVRTAGRTMKDVMDEQLDKFDTDRDGTISRAEAEAVTEINIAKVSSVDGIEKFTQLKLLSCINSELVSLDLSKNSALTGLLFYECLLTSLDVSKNAALTHLLLTGTQLSVSTSQTTAN